MSYVRHCLLCLGCPQVSEEDSVLAHTSLRLAVGRAGPSHHCLLCLDVPQVSDVTGLIGFLLGRCVGTPFALPCGGACWAFAAAGHILHVSVV
jgi:hypothetical protein